MTLTTGTPFVRAACSAWVVVGPSVWAFSNSTLTLSGPVNVASVAARTAAGPVRSTAATSRPWRYLTRAGVDVAGVADVEVSTAPLEAR